MSNRSFTVRIFNTVEPVTTMYRDLIPYWEAMGWQIVVFISRAEYRSGRQTTWIREHTQVQWTSDLGQKTDTRFGKLLIMITYILSAMVHSLFGPAVERNLFLTQPPLFFLWGYVLKRLRKQPYYIVLMDLYPQVALQAGLLDENSVGARVLSRLSQFGMQHADGVFAIGRCMRERVIDLGVLPERVHFIPNWADEEAVRPIPDNENKFRQDQGWQDKFVVMYSGNMGTAHYFGDLLEVCRRLQTREELVFAFIGKGQRRGEIEDFKERHSLQNIVLLPFQPQEEIDQTLSAGDVHFVSLRSGYTGLVVPSKIYGILAVGVPTIYQGDDQGEIARMIAEENVGIVVPLGNPVELERQVLWYVANAALATSQSERGRELAESKYSKHRACERYTAVLAPGI